MMQWSNPYYCNNQHQKSLCFKLWIYLDLFLVPHDYYEQTLQLHLSLFAASREAIAYEGAWVSLSQAYSHITD